MSDDRNLDKPTGLKLNAKEVIYGVILVVGFIAIMSGLNGALGWGLADALVAAIGATLGVVAALALAWLRNR